MTPKATVRLALSILAVLAEASVLFRPGPVDGRSWVAGHPADKGVLSWEPTYAEVSRGGDLGCTSGTWQYRDASPGGPPPTYGHYLTMWRREAKGPWKVVLDLGVSHPKPPDPAPAAAFREPAPAPAGDAAPGGAPDLLAAEQGAAQASERLDARAALREFAADDVRLYREGVQPAIGSEAALALLGEKAPRLAFEMSGAEVAASGDLAYAFGSWRAAGKPAGPARADGYYARVWRRDPSGAWRIALDMARDAPPSK
jgi:ketosteroid isomerase-like protein